MATTDLAPSLADWERMEDPPSGRLEVLDGKVIVSAAPRLIHQIVVQALAAEFDRQCPPGLKAGFDVEWRKLRTCLRSGRRASRLDAESLGSCGMWRLPPRRRAGTTPTSRTSSGL